MRAVGVRNVLICCLDHRCGHFNVVPDDADRWPDELRISDIEDKFVCTHPILARNLRARRNNLLVTIATLQSQLVEAAV